MRLGVDLKAGTSYRSGVMPDQPPVVLVFDSGLGGLTVHREIAALLPLARYVYAADDAAFPYGGWDEQALIERIVAVMARLVDRCRPDLVVIACNTASTLALPALRARFPIPFVGTVPAIKPAAERTRTGRIAVLATPGTVRRDYTRALIEAYAGDVAVELVGSSRLAGLAEAAAAGAAVPDAAIAAEIAPCFVETDGRATDVVVLACTHYPLLLDRMRRLAPWPVEWIDPAPAIARRVAALAGTAGGEATPGLALFTGEGLAAARLAAAGFGRIETGVAPLPLH